MVRAANERTPIFYLGCAAWLVVAVLLIAWDFGVVAFCGSILLAIWVFGLREKFANEETASAYSVFNKDGKAIVGGFTAEQFDRQMRGGLASNNNDAVRGSVAVAKNESHTITQAKINDQERLRRRKAAVAAAERRVQEKQEISG
jgi:hypothetical protein